MVGLASGMLSGALNEGGPPVVIFFALQGWAKDEVKAALQASCTEAACFLVVRCERWYVSQYADLWG